jgi:thiol-disulfide isomerase/thioredoxin
MRLMSGVFVKRSLVVLALGWIAGAAIHRESMGAPFKRDTTGPAPAFALEDVEGRILRPPRDRALLLNFWATWCGPCRSELPDLQELSRTHSACLAVVGVAVDSGSATEVAAFARDHGLTYALARDDGETARSFRVVTIPHTVLVAPTGAVVGTFRGPVTAKGVEAALREAGLLRPGC